MEVDKDREAELLSPSDRANQIWVLKTSDKSREREARQYLTRNVRLVFEHVDGPVADWYT